MLILKDGKITLSDKDLEALQHLKNVAERKRFFAEFVANLYDNRIKCDFRSCANYVLGESVGDERLSSAIRLMTDLAMQGLESHEYLGEEFVRSVISRHGLRD